MKLDIVMQGPIWGVTYGNAVQFLNNEFVNSVIISTWEEDHVVSDNARIIIVKTKKPENNDIGNMNLQIVSTMEGLKLTKSHLVLKIRSDEFITQPSMMKLYQFVCSNINNTNIEYFDGTRRLGNLFVLSIHNEIPFHPRDHIFCGYREDMIKLFNIPLTPKYLHKTSFDFSKNIRSEVYLAAMYFANFYPKEINNYLENFLEYLVDNCPKNDAKILSKLKINEIFKVLPKLDIRWCKYPQFPTYPYSWYGSMGDYSYD